MAATRNANAPGLLRRLAAIAYDSLLLGGILILASALVVLPLGQAVAAGTWWFRLLLLAIVYGFFVGFWSVGGQTLGMRAWRLRVVRDDGMPLRLRDASLRFVAALPSWACLGLGFLWIWIDPQRRALHDRLSRTHLVLLDKD